MIMERVKEVQDILEFKQNTIYTKQATLRLTTRDDDISMNMLRIIYRQHDISWVKQLPDAYIIEQKEKPTDDLLFDLASKTPTYFVEKNLVDLEISHDILLNKSVEKVASK